MKKQSLYSYGLLFLIFLLTSTLTGCGCDRKKTDKTEAPALLVKTIVIESEKAKAKRSYPGKVVAAHKVDLAFQVPGQLINFPVKEGEVVQKGQLIGKLDDRDYQHQHNERLARLKKAKRDLYRAAELLKSGTIPEATYDQRKAAYDIAVANTATTKKALDDTSLLAPFTGLIANTYVDNYQTVTAKQRIVSLQDISYIDIEIDIPEQEIVGTKIEDHTKIHGKLAKDSYVVFLSRPHDKHQVWVKEYKTEADPVTQTFKITVTMPSPKKFNILPGMTATLVTHKSLTDETTFLVPSHVVATDKDGKKYVWLVNDDMTVTKKLVTTGELSDGKIQITEGVEAGDRLVSAGLFQLEEGMKVRVLTGNIKDQ